MRFDFSKLLKHPLGYVLIVHALFMYSTSLDQFPVYTHAWTQTDRLALSYCFADNGLDLFHPCTYDLATVDGITPAGWPVAEYIAAIPMMLFGKSVVWVRLTYLFFLWLAAVFLFSLARSFDISRAGSSVLMCFFLFSPILSYYGSGILPTISSVGLVLGSVYYFKKYLRSPDLRSGLWCASLALLATLNRWTFGVGFIAMLAVLAAEVIKGKRRFGLSEIPFLVAPVLIVLLFWRDQLMAAEYGSAFLMNPNVPGASPHRMVDLVEAFKSWNTDYFTPLQFSWIVLVFTAALWQGKGLKTRDKRLMYVALIWFGLGFIAAFMLAAQFIHHDYYFVDTLFLPSVLLVVLIFPSFSERSRKWGKAFIGFSMVAAFMWLINAKVVQKERNAGGFWNENETLYNDFIGARSFLDNETVPETATLFIPNSISTNAAMMLTGRKGHSLVWTDSLRLDSCLGLPFDYTLIQNRYLLSDIIGVHSGVMQQLEKKADNGVLSLYTRNNSNRSLESFLNATKGEQLSSQELERFLKESDSMEVVELEYGLNLNFDKDYLKGRRHVLVEIEFEESNFSELLFAVKQEGFEHLQHIVKDGKVTNRIWIGWPEDKDVQMFLFNPQKATIRMKDIKLTIH